MTLGEKIQELRRKNAMSQDVLAERLDVSRQAVSKWERDEAMPEAEKVIRIAQLFRVSTDYLLMQEPEQEQKQKPVQHHGKTESQGYNRQRVERFVRRHGYKGGYILAGVGAMVDLICLLFRAWWQSAVSSMGSISSGMFGDSFVPGFGMGDPMLDGFNQATQNMNNMASSWGNIYLIGLIPGTVMIALGIYIIVKGKKLAKEEAHR